MTVLSIRIRHLLQTMLKLSLICIMQQAESLSFSLSLYLLVLAYSFGYKVVLKLCYFPFLHLNLGHFDIRYSKFPWSKAFNHGKYIDHIFILFLILVY